MRILSDNPLARKYGYSENASSKAPQKISEVIGLIDNQLKNQAEKGSPYLVGESISALDIYWATMSMTISPVSLEIMPATHQNQGMLKMFEAVSSIPQIENTVSERIKNIRTIYCENIARDSCRLRWGSTIGSIYKVGFIFLGLDYLVNLFLKLIP